MLIESDKMEKLIESFQPLENELDNLYIKDSILLQKNNSGTTIIHMDYNDIIKDLNIELPNLKSKLKILKPLKKYDFDYTTDEYWQYFKAKNLLTYKTRKVIADDLVDFTTVNVPFDVSNEKLITSINIDRDTITMIKKIMTTFNSEFFTGIFENGKLSLKINSLDMNQEVTLFDKLECDVDGIDILNSEKPLIVEMNLIPINLVSSDIDMSLYINELNSSTIHIVYSGYIGEIQSKIYSYSIIPMD